jgi:hypothetical protein
MESKLQLFFWMKGQTALEKFPKTENLSPTLSQTLKSFCGYVILFHSRINEDAVLRDLAPLSLLQAPSASLQRSPAPQDPDQSF